MFDTAPTAPTASMPAHASNIASAVQLAHNYVSRILAALDGPSPEVAMGELRKEAQNPPIMESLETSSRSLGALCTRLENLSAKLGA